MLDHTALGDDDHIVSEDAHAERLKLLVMGTHRTKSGKVVLGPKSPRSRPLQLSRGQMLGVVMESTDNTQGKAYEFPLLPVIMLMSIRLMFPLPQLQRKPQE
jgi:hypothetical protein